MTFLSKVGMFLAKGIAILTGLEPLLAPFFGSKAQAAESVGGRVLNDLTAVGQVVISAEAMMQTPGSGAVKLAAAAPLVASIVKTSELISGHQIANEALFLQGCTNLTSAVAQILNALSPNNVKSAGSPLPPTPAATNAPVPTELAAPPTV